MTACIHQLSKDGNALRGVCAALIAERDTMQIARDAMQSERDTMQAERDMAFQQRDAFERKRDAMQAELDTAQRGLDTAQRERDAAKAHAEKIAAELALAKRELRMRMHALYGRRSERMSDKDLGLFAAFIEVEKEKAAAEKAQEAEAIDITRVSAHTRKGKNGRGEIPAHLPRENVLHELKGDELKCPCCGKPRWCIGEEVSEQLDCVPATVKVIRITKKKYACPDCLKGVVLALPPPRAIEKCKAAPGMLATVAVSKYADHLPAYRQEGILQRAGLLIRRSTLCDWMRRVAEALAPLISLITRLVLASRVIATDDTPVKMLEPGRGQTREARLWVYVGGGTREVLNRVGGVGGIGLGHKYAVYDFSVSREGKWPRKWLDGYVKNGEVKHMQADAFAGYDQLYLPPPENGMDGTIIEVGCWAHVRRKFYDSRQSAPELCLPVLMLIKRLYAVEAQSGDLHEDAAARAARRREHSAPVLARIKALLDAAGPLPKSDVGEAVRYALNLWPALNRYIENGELSIDNNECERALRGVAIGRKNWLFIGSEEGGATAAAMFTVIGSARMHEIEPWAYLKDVLERIATVTAAQLHELLPDIWAKAHPQHHLPLGR